MNEDGGKDCFPMLQHFVTSSEVDLTHELKYVFEKRQLQFSDWFASYFPEDMEKFAWVQDSFKAKTPSEFTSAEEKTLIELPFDKTLKTKFGGMQRTEFWISLKDEYPLLSAKAQRIIIPFATSYFFEAGFSAVAVIKSKNRAKINVEQEMRVVVSNLIPRFEKLCCARQAHTSH
ncbi:protein FAM200A-like [Tachypleus tridentatus]|uniref:protein FAM200A-like n=1 Tax=Tachypleus tridentatus TaxID=6853 RepID=UPI003FCFE4A1